MTRRRLIVPALAVATALAVAAPVGSQAGGPPAVAGAQGIGDPYFPQDGNGGYRVARYDVHDSYRFSDGRLSGSTTITLRTTERLSSFDLDFLLPVSAVTLSTGRATFDRPDRHELRITPAHPIPAGTRLTATVRYAGHPARLSWGGESNWVADAHEVAAINEPHMAAWWFPSNDHPLDKALMDLHLTVPKGYQVVAGGRLVSVRRAGDRTTYHWHGGPMATYLAFFAAGSFAVSRSRCDGVPNIFAVSRRINEKAPSKAARAWARQTCRTIRQLSGVLGAYPFASMGGLATSLPVSFSLENQTRPTYPALGLSGQPELMTHELAHQWFGDLVSVADWRDVWLNEGFASFMADFSVELDGGLTMRDWLDQSYQSLVDDKEFWALPIDDPGPRHLFDGAVYVRGEMAVQALRQRIGDPAFLGLLRTWLAQHAYGNGSVADFESLAGSVSGQDLTAFFDAWLHEPAPPARTAANGFL